MLAEVLVVEVLVDEVGWVELRSCVDEREDGRAEGAAGFVWVSVSTIASASPPSARRPAAMSRGRR